MRRRRVAIVHEWLTTYAGSERVLEQMLEVFPDADLFAVCDFMSSSERAFLRGRAVQTTFVQRLPFARTRYRGWLPVMPFAIEQLDLSAYDLVISSNHAVAKGVLTGPDQLHLCMCYSPIRYAWDLQHQYLRQAGIGWRPRGIAARWAAARAAAVGRALVERRRCVRGDLGLRRATHREGVSPRVDRRVSARRRRALHARG